MFNFISTVQMLEAISEDDLKMLRGAAQFNGGNCASSFRDEKGQNMLMIAVNLESHKCLAYLLQNGAKVNIDEVDSAGNTALMHAAQKGDAVSIRLLSAFFADKSLRNTEGLTAYDLAARSESGDSKFSVCMESLDPLAFKERQYASESKEFFSDQYAEISDKEIAEFFGLSADQRAITIVPVSAEDFPGADIEILESFFDLP